MQSLTELCFIKFLGLNIFMIVNQSMYIKMNLGLTPPTTQANKYPFQLSKTQKREDVEISSVAT